MLQEVVNNVCSDWCQEPRSQWFLKIMSGSPKFYKFELFITTSFEKWAEAPNSNMLSFISLMWVVLEWNKRYKMYINVNCPSITAVFNLVSIPCSKNHTWLLISEKVLTKSNLFLQIVKKYSKKDYGIVSQILATTSNMISKLWKSSIMWYYASCDIMNHVIKMNYYWGLVHNYV